MVSFVFIENPQKKCKTESRCTNRWYFLIHLHKFLTNLKQMTITVNVASDTQGVLIYKCSGLQHEKYKTNEVRTFFIK